jgi:hypothetical protein
LALSISGVRAEDTNLPPVQLTAQQDHQRIMGLLHMTSFRRRKDDANYNEAKANPYPDLPESKSGCDRTFHLDLNDKFA